MDNKIPCPICNDTQSYKLSNKTIELLNKGIGANLRDHELLNLCLTSEDLPCDTDLMPIILATFNYIYG